VILAAFRAGLTARRDAPSPRAHAQQVPLVPQLLDGVKYIEPDEEPPPETRDLRRIRHGKPPRRAVAANAGALRAQMRQR
jgi:hypothetical protein